MFGVGDNNDNPQNTQNQSVPVHGPFGSNIQNQSDGPPSQVKTPMNDITFPQSAPTAPPSGDDELLEIKQRALSNLTPLLNHLDQTPEEKFKTTMMLIQASDDPQLLAQAHEAANKIEDEKIRAQALLDVVNEINYFTHQAKNQN